MSRHTSDDGLLLPGIDGTNPLGFLAALGVLASLSRIDGLTSARMRWTLKNATWVPCIMFDASVSLTEDGLLDKLVTTLVNDRSRHPANLYEQLQDEVNSRRSFFETVVSDASLTARARVDFLSAIASDASPDDAVNQLQTTRRDYHLGNIDSILSATTRDHLLRTLFVAWDYSDPLNNQSLHLDPTEDRRHAYQWNKPSGDPSRNRVGGMLGANRLAIEAIALFTSFPRNSRLATVGFRGSRSHDTFWTWPIWGTSVSLDVAKTTLAIEELQADEFDSSTRKRLKAQGIIAAYRTQRILVEKTPNFTPPYRVA